jgi:ribulose-phosphate 3-epimerase
MVREISRRGLKAGVAILPGSTVPPDIVEVLPEVAMVIGNTVGPAYAGQPFDRRGLKNLTQLSRLVAENGWATEVAADGNVSLEHLEELIGAGCTHLVCGTSSIFKPDANVGEALRFFRQQVNTHNS